MNTCLYITGPGVVLQQGRENLVGRFGETASRRTGKVSAHPKRMLRLGINREGKTPAKPPSPHIQMDCCASNPGLRKK